MSTFITALDANGSGPTVAVKDLIDVAGVPTTAGSRAVAEHARPAALDAPLLAGFRAADARIVGKANLHELAFGTSGINAWSGTPRNPLDERLVPGGSSSGSAVAVATYAAELAIGTDTGGSIRIPAAFCGVCGLKTTFGRIDLTGVWPLAPSLDTVGPIARTVSGIVRTMQLLEAGFEPSAEAAVSIGRLRLPGEDVHPAIDEAVDEALAESGYGPETFEVPEWGAAWAACSDLLVAEAAATNRSLIDSPERAALLGADVRDRLESAAAISSTRLEEAGRFRLGWSERLAELFARVQLLALPTTASFPPAIEDSARGGFNRLTNPVNLAGLPALSVPVRSFTDLPASLQLVGPPGSEELLVATGARIEAARGS